MFFRKLIINNSGGCLWFVGSIGFIYCLAILSCTSANEKIKAGSPLFIQSIAPEEKEAALIDYGKDLIANTAHYLGPKGTVAALSNGMNCQNCHLKGGQQLYANSYLAVAATYPRFSPRSGSAETIVKKVNDCFERSLNGQKLDSTSKEMKAIVAYIIWVGTSGPMGGGKSGGGTQQLAYLNRAANPVKGNHLFQQKCVRCHGTDGQGQFNFDSSAYIYPPLWGQHSYNVSAGIFRMTRLAGFIKNNMPFGATYEAPQLTEEEAWDIAAYINSQPRSAKKFAEDWPVISQKPVDYPFGPYSDKFSEKQHKYGPFTVIAAQKEQKKR